MRLGLLGIDARMMDVALAARRRGDRIVATHGVDASRLRDLDAPATGGWEPLLDAAVCDAVLVGGEGWDDERAAAVRTLVQAGRPLILAQPLELSMLWAYELDMIRRDTGALLVPCLPDRLHPFVGRLRDALVASLAGAGPAGAVESLHLERRMPDRSRAAVLAQLARDADLVRAVVGDPAKLSTLGAADPDTAWGTLAVGLSGPTQVPVRWQVAPGAVSGLVLRLQSAAGATEITAPDDDAPWTFTPPVGSSESLAFDRGATILGVLDRAIASAAGRGTEAPEAATWSDAARAIELAETVPRSLTRGRAIDLHREEFTEMGTFRGTMASLGCGLIVAALVVVVLATLVAGIAREFGWRFAGSIVDAWPAIVLGVLGLFLLLQLLPLLVATPEGGDETPRPPDRHA
jgi:predicted dehydrogenase